MEDFLIKMAEIFEVNSINPNDEITSFETWDSLTSLSVIALIDEDYGISISADDIIKAVTFEGLYALLVSGK
jgi:acyl carrier protein